MTSFCPVVEGASVRLVPDAEYLRVMQALTASARELLWCSVFLIELTPMADPDLLVPGVLRGLASARWRGVDVRLLIGGSRTNLEIAEDAATALKVARRLGLPAPMDPEQSRPRKPYQARDRGRLRADRISQLVTGCVRVGNTGQRARSLTRPRRVSRPAVGEAVAASGQQEGSRGIAWY